MKKIAIAFTLVIAAATVVILVHADDKETQKFAGTKSCKMCHKKEADGNQYGKWVAGPHAKAIEVLSTDEAKATAKKLGIEDPSKSPKCLKCHSTAYYFSEEVQTTKIKVEEGVSCESCHGPGAAYKKKSVMKDREASIAAGMVHPALDSCAKCHNEEAPTWNPERYTTKDGEKVGFDRDQAYEKISHNYPEKK